MHGCNSFSFLGVTCSFFDFLAGNIHYGTGAEVAQLGYLTINEDECEDAIYQLKKVTQG